MWVPGSESPREGAVIGKPADGGRWPSSVTLGPCSASNLRLFPIHASIRINSDPVSSRNSPWHDLNPSPFEDAWRSNRKPKITKMIPETESVCETSEAAVRSTDVFEKIKNNPEKEAASVTAWKRYQELVAAMESRGGKYNRKSMIEAIFRGNDLVYASH